MEFETKIFSLKDSLKDFFNLVNYQEPIISYALVLIANNIPLIITLSTKIESRYNLLTISCDQAQFHLIMKLRALLIFIDANTTCV